MANPFDHKHYATCCGAKPRFMQEQAIKTWFAECPHCKTTVCAIDGRPDGLAAAWNQVIEKKGKGKV